MDFRIFADESGTHDESTCYGIGALCLEHDESDQFKRQADAILQKFGINEELKWHSIGRQGSHHEASYEIGKLVLLEEYVFHVIVVWKDIYEKWAIDPERAFYMSYFQLIKNIAKSKSGKHAVFIDNRSDRYKKHDEALEIITNRYLRKEASQTELKTVEMRDSSGQIAIQAVDILIGAITTSTNAYLNAKAKPNAAKQDIITRLAAHLGWDALHYDTFPSDSLNIWHFPMEFRAKPGTREIARSNELRAT